MTVPFKFANQSGPIPLSELDANFAAVNTSVSEISFDTTAPAPAWAEGKVFYDNTDHTLAYYNDSTGVTVNIGQEELIRVRNNTGSTLTDGQVVYINGALGNRPTVALARANAEATSEGVIGVVTDAIANNADGYVTTSGLIHGLNTNAYAEGTQLFLSTSTAGAWTSTAPTAPDNLIRVGYVVRQHVNQGVIFVRVQVGYELSELDDVKITTVATNDLLQWDAALGYWKNVASPVINGNTVISVTDNTNAALRITQLGTGNALVVEDSANPDGTPFVIDASGNVGIGTVPGASTRLDAYSTASSSSVIRARNDTTTVYLDANNGFSYLNTFTNHPMLFGTNNVERMRIDNAGRVGIGIIPSSASTLHVQTTTTGATTKYGVINTHTVASDVTASFINNISTIATNSGGTGIAGAAIHYDAAQGSFSGVVTTQIGYRVQNTLTGATNNYGFYGDIAAGTGRYNFYAAGTADNYMAGNLGVGVTPGFNLHVGGGTGNPAVAIDHAEAGTGGAAMVFRKSRGSSGSPSAVLSADYIGAILARGYGATGWSANIALAGFKAAENFTDTSQGTDFVVEMATSGTVSRTEKFRVDNIGNALVTNSGGGLGYGTGSGGTVTQATSKSTAVTLNKPTGKITTHNASLAAGATVTFVLNNSLISVNDLIITGIDNSSVGSAAFNYRAVINSSAGAAVVQLTNNSGGALGEAVGINFAIIKGAIA